jgi:hypothetical protein
MTKVTSQVKSVKPVSFNIASNASEIRKWIPATTAIIPVLVFMRVKAF